MQDTHRTLNKAMFIMSFILIAYSELAQALDYPCPGSSSANSSETAIPFPAVVRVEIANPQAPSKPHLANPSSNTPNDLRTLMAFQGETIDLIFTFAEPIRSGCVYPIEISKYPSHINGSNWGSHTPWQPILSPRTGYHSEPTTGDNTIKFKLATAPQFDEDKVHLLYASISRGSGYFLTEPTPFKFKNVAYKIINVVKAPAPISVNGNAMTRLRATLNAMPKTNSNSLLFKGATWQYAPLNASSVSAPIVKPERSKITPPSIASKPLKQLSLKPVELNKAIYENLLHWELVMINGAPTLEAIVAEKGDVDMLLKLEAAPGDYFLPNRDYPETHTSLQQICKYSKGNIDEYCSSRTFVDLPD